MKKLLLVTPIVVGLIPKVTFAHCPLCTVGAGALAVFAAYLGVSTIIVGILIGAFALALGAWIAPMLKKKYVPYQKEIIVALVFLSTVIPIMPLVREYGPFYLALGGEYGTLFHNTYTINLFLFGSFLGAFIVAIVPFISKQVTKIRGVQIPFQGMSITLVLLVITSVVVQILVW